MNADVITDVSDKGGTGRLMAGVKMVGDGERWREAERHAISAGDVAAAGGTLHAGNDLDRPVVDPKLQRVGQHRPARTASRDSSTSRSLRSAHVPMQNDVLQLANLQTACQASWQADRIDIEKSSIQCDFGNAR